MERKVVSVTARVGVGLIGVGRLAQATHLPSVLALPNARIVGLCDARPERVAAVAATFALSMVPVVEDYRALLENPDVEAVIVSVPNALHAPVTLAALAAGKHVLCEKPPALNAAEAREMLQAARANGCLLTYGFQHRQRDDVRHLRALIAEGILGDIYYAKVKTLRWRGAPRGWFTDRQSSGGGTLIDTGVHLLDLALYLMAYPAATRVSAATYNAFGASLPFGARPWQAADVYDGLTEASTYDVEDLATAFIRFGNGAVLHLESAWALHVGHEGTSNDVGLYGRRGGAELHPHLSVHTELGGQLVDVRPVVRGDGIPEHRRGVKAFIDAIQRGERGTGAAEQGLALMRIIDAIYASAAGGHEVAVA
jgi:predicted dehydrogenase